MTQGFDPLAGEWVATKSQLKILPIVQPFIPHTRIV